MIGCAALTAFLLQLLGYIICNTVFKGKGDQYYDLFGSLGFIVQLVYIYFEKGQELNQKQIISIVLVLIWCLRLGAFLFYRAHVFNGDTRFEKIKTNPIRFAVAFFLQFLWNFITLLPTLILLNKNSNDVGQLYESSLDIIGLIIYTIGFNLETIADFQKLTFKLNPKNEGKFIQSGLWSRSRHPNYLGEFSIWVGNWVFCCSSYQGFEYLTILSPLFIIWLIVRVSGIKLLEIKAEKVWGSNKEYQQYKQKAGVLFFKF